MICPHCNHPACRRSHRSGVRDFFVGVFGLRPWRCDSCRLRFFGTRVPLRYLLRAHCTKCGNLELQRISGRHGEGEFKYLWRAIGIPAYRCPNCRRHLFSSLPRRRPASRPAQTSTAA